MGTRLSLEEKIGELITAQATTDAVSESTDDQVIITPTSSKFETSTSDAGLLVSLDELQVVDVLETTKSVSRKTFPHFDLETLLHTSAGGNSILKYYETYGFLNNTKRNQLTDIIIKHIYTYIVNYRITYEEYNIISAKIISLFPKESIGTYFTKPIKKNNSFNGRSTVARGKLVDKVRNLLYKYGDHTHKRQSGTLENAPPFKRQYIQGLQDLHLRDILFLNNNTEPWGEVIQKWKDTFKVRKESEHKSVHEFLQDWKILSDQRSDILINIDFDLLYPEKGLNFYLNWKIFFEKIIAFKPNRDERILNLIESLKNLDNDLTLPAELKILAHLVPPKGRISKKIKFTTQEAIDSLYICVPNAGDIDQVIKEQKQKATSKKLSVQPYVILQGSLLECGSPLLIVDDTVLLVTMTPTPQEQVEINAGPEIDGQRVVISGISGMYPQSYHVKHLEDILYNKKNPVTADKCRWDFNHPEVSNYTGKTPGLDRFDAQFFKVHYRQAHVMDALNRKLLEQAFQAIYDAGLSPEHLSGKKVGVFIGSCFSETDKAFICNAATGSGLAVTGCNRAMFANRISYWLNAKGPSVAVDASDCSGLTALEQGCQAVLRGDCVAALVGASYICLHPQSTVHFARVVKISKDGKTKSFDQNADGCAKSDAVNMLLLQKAKDAKRIYAEVVHVKSEFTELLETEVGPKFGFCRDSQVAARFMNEFYTEAGVPPHAVEYVEAFGAAGSEADKEELEAIETVFCKERHEPLLVGSVMSNIGYTQAASGISAITKVILGYQRAELAANMHCTTPRQDIEAIRDGRMKVVTEHTPINPMAYVAVNSNAVTGINAHALLKGYYKPKDRNRYKCNFPRLVTISARQDINIQNTLNDLKNRPIDPEEIALFHNIHKHRISGYLGRGYIILDTDEEQKTVCLEETVAVFDDTKRPLWYVYSGMGSQWAGMGVHLMRIPIFAAAIERCRIALEPKGIDIVHIITSPDKTIFDNILNSFVGIAAIQIGLTDVLKSIGLEPDKVIGHSVGELGCAYADGCFTAEEMILSAYSRGLVSIQTPFIHGSMAAVGLGCEKVLEMLPPEIEVACHNSSESSTISGPSDIMKKFVAKLRAEGIFAKEVPCSNIAYHSRYIAEAGPGLLKYLSEVIKDPKERSERWVSTSVPQEKWGEPTAKYSSAEYHTNNLLNPVLFEETAQLIPTNAVLVEIAPHGLLQAILKRSMPSCNNIPLTRRGHPDNAIMVLDAIGKLFIDGYNLDIAALYPTIQFPVSTNTPMLSHFVEWAHTEKWNVPLYKKGSTQKNPICNFVPSIFDDEHSYLQGHVLRGKNPLPFAAAIEAVWDTYAMIQGSPRRQLQVELRDVCLFVQPPLHATRATRLRVYYFRGSGKFEVHNEMGLVASGFIDKGLCLDMEHFRSAFESKETMDLVSDDVYQLFHEKDYQYEGEFRSIHRANSSFTEAQIIWKNNWVTLLDGMLQLDNLRQSHSSFSTPTKIRRIMIDNNRVTDDNIIKEHDKKLLVAQVFEKYDYMRCGGILLESIRYQEISITDEISANLEIVEFVPHFDADIDTAVAWKVYLQIVSENINKGTINIVGITNQAKDTFCDLKVGLHSIAGISFNYSEISTDKMLTLEENFLSETDLVLVQNLSLDEHMGQILYRVLKRDTFIVNREETVNDRVRPSALYSVLSSHSINNTKLELLKWRPTHVASESAVVTVRTAFDLDYLAKTRLSLSFRTKLVILSPYPSVPGLKTIVKQWRKETDQPIYLVSVTDQDNMEQLPDTNLAFSVLCNGIWGGEYYLPCPEVKAVENRMVLQSGHVGDINSMFWTETSDVENSKLKVVVHYAALSNLDMQKATSVVPVITDHLNSNCYGMDFSGVTETGERVMGLLPRGAASTTVLAIPELVWPVPKHWTLEDAVTIPSAFAHAYYILRQKMDFIAHKHSILIHGGAGALGQALISIALSTGSEVFTTVSDISKKRFLTRLFPQLKEDHIFNSRDPSFSDMVILQTNGKGCSVVVTAAKGELKEMYCKVCKHSGFVVDVDQINSQENFTYKMFYLTRGRNYARVNFNDLFGDPEAIKAIQTLMSEGIARGFVRPLSRVIYDAVDVPRALNLLASSAHRGRVLLRMHQKVPVWQSRVTCSPALSHVVVCADEIVGIQLSDRLVRRGAKKLLLHICSSSGYLRQKIRSWEKNGVNVQIATADLDTKGVTNLLNVSNHIGPVEGIYMIVNNCHGNKVVDYLSTLTNLDLVSRRLCPSLRYFAVINLGSNIGRKTCLERSRLGLPATTIDLYAFSNSDEAVSGKLTWRSLIDATEAAVCSAQVDVAAFPQRRVAKTVTEQIADLAGIQLSDDPEMTYLVNPAKVPIIQTFLRTMHNVPIDAEDLITLTAAKLRSIEEYLGEEVRKELHGLGTFYSCEHFDELKGTIPVVPLQTLTEAEPQDYEYFDVTKRYVCIVPGLEGHYARFRLMCERFKTGAVVLQPSLDCPYDTAEQTADKYAQLLRDKVNIQDNFYLVGYESGVLVVLELAAILEGCGLKGTVFCIGGAPEEFQATLKHELREYQSDEELQNAVIRHMFVLMKGDDDGLDEVLEKVSTFKERIDVCVRLLLGRVPHSAQYAKTLILSAYTRIKLALQYKPQPRQLNSRVILLHSPSMILEDPRDTPVTLLQQYSKQPVVVHELHEPLAHAALDLRISAIINTYFDKNIKEAYEKANLCENHSFLGDLCSATQYFDWS